MNPRNPFCVLELPPDATPGEIERQGRKLLGLFDVGATKAARYACPLGAFPRDATMVRDAMAALRDPKARARAALLARLLVLPEEGAARATAPDDPLKDAFSIIELKGL